MLRSISKVAGIVPRFFFFFFEMRRSFRMVDSLAESILRTLLKLPLDSLFLGFLGVHLGSAGVDCGEVWFDE